MRTGEAVVGEGVVLRYLESGSGRPIVMLPGWSQTAEMFGGQLGALGEGRRALALDHRGHGSSDKPPLGYHLHRLAADVHDVLTGLDLQETVLLGHSMGAAVTWSYLELFGPERLGALVLVDQMPCALRNPRWSDQEALEAGATLEPAALFEFTDGLRAGEEAPRSEFLRAVTSAGLASEKLEWMAGQNELLPRRQAAELIFDTATHDWRALIPSIRLPTLVIAGNSVNVPIASQEWIHRSVPDSRFARIEAVSGGTHFPFLESPREFNEAVSGFLDSL